MPKYYNTDKLKESFANYGGINLTGNQTVPGEADWSRGFGDNACFFLQKGSDDYPFNQESYNPFGKPYAGSEPGPVYNKSLDDVCNGLYDMSYQMYTLSKQSTDYTGVMYVGAKKSLNPDSEGNLIKFLDVNEITKTSVEDDQDPLQIIPCILFDVTNVIKMNEVDFVKSSSSPDQGRDYILSGNDFVNERGQNVNDFIMDNVDGVYDVSTLSASGTQGSVKIVKVGFKNSSSEEYAGKYYGRINFLEVQFTGITTGNSPAYLYFTIYFNPEFFYEERLGNPDNVDVWSYYDKDDPYNIWYTGDLYTKVHDKAVASGDSHNTNEFILSIDSSELSSNIVFNILKDKRYSRHRFNTVLTLDRRIFEGTANGVHKLTEGETDYRTKMNFYIFYSSDDAPGEVTKREAVRKILSDYVDANYSEAIKYVKVDDFGSSAGGDKVTGNVIKYVYPELDSSYKVYIRPLVDLVSGDYSGEDDFTTNKIRLSVKGVDFAFKSNGSSIPPFYTKLTSRGEVYQVITPCVVRNKIVENPSDTSFNKTLMNFPMIAHTFVEDENDNIDPSKYDYLQNYFPDVIELVENVGSGIQWDVSDSPQIKFKKLFTYTAIVLSGADPQFLDDTTPLAQALKADPSLFYQVTMDGNKIKYFQFTISGTVYYVVNKNVKEIESSGV